MKIQTFIELYLGTVDCVKSTTDCSQIKLWEKEFLVVNNFKNIEEYNNAVENGCTKIEFVVIENILYD